MAPNVSKNTPGSDEPEGDEDSNVSGLSVPVTIHLAGANSSGSSDTDDEEWSNSPTLNQNQALGYQLLPQDPENNNDVVAVVTHNHQEPQLPTNSNSPVYLIAPCAQDDEKDEAGGWSRPFEMDHDHIEKIKAAMAGFTLPNSSIPPWVAVVPEDQLKDHLLTLITRRTEQCNPQSSKE